MKAKDLEKACEQFAFMAKHGKEMIKGMDPEAEVQIRNDKDRATLFFASWIWAPRAVFN